MTASRCLVIGGSGALGRRIVASLRHRSADVAFTYFRSRDVAAQLVQEHGAMPHAALDLSQPDGVEAALTKLCDQLGGLDALIHCAALPSTCEPPRFDALEDVSLAGWQRLLDVNVTSAFLACRALSPRMRGGNIVLMGSVDGVKPIPTPVPYAVSKAALRGLVLSLAKTLGPDDVRINLVAPGILDEGASRVVPKQLRDQYLKHSALKRYGELREASDIVTWLALDNSYVTGQTWLVDGGL
jgi:NAD(P)-dependent dehydrogenase (short-subunit alcohol dehydrogenase family)